jgi:hypothetical protein
MQLAGKKMGEPPGSPKLQVRAKLDENRVHLVSLSRLDTPEIKHLGCQIGNSAKGNEIKEEQKQQQLGIYKVLEVGFWRFPVIIGG